MSSLLLLKKDVHSCFLVSIVFFLPLSTLSLDQSLFLGMHDIYRTDRLSAQQWEMLCYRLSANNEIIADKYSQ